MDFEIFMDHNGSTQRPLDLMQLGPASQMVYARVRNEGKTRTLIAGAFWRAFIASNAFFRSLAMLQASSLAFAAGRYLIAPQRGAGRFDLLVLDPGLPDREQPRALEIDRTIFSPGEVYRGVQLAELAGVPPDLPNFTDVVAEAAFLGSPFTIVIAPHPPTESLSVLLTPTEN